MSIPLSTITKGPSFFGWQSKLDRPIRVATFGDSTADSCNFTTTATEDFLIAFPSAGQTSYANVRGHVASVYQKANCVLVANGGIAGQVTTQMIARSTAVDSATRKSIQDVLAMRPDVVLLHGGSINDVITLVNESSAQSVIDGIVSRHIAIARAFINAGVFVVDTGVYGYSSAVSEALLTVRRSAIVFINNEIKTQSSESEKWIFGDVEGVLSTSGAFISGMSDDGVHLNAKGAAYLGSIESPIVSNLFSVVQKNSIMYNGSKDFENDTAGVPATFTLTFSGMTVNSKTSDISGFRANVTVTNAVNFLQLYTGSPGALSFLSPILANDRFSINAKMNVSENGSDVNFEVTNQLVLKPVGNASAINFQLLTAGCLGMADFSHQVSSPVAFADFGSQSYYWIGPANLPVGTYDIFISPMVVRKYSVLS